jgi:hypothetical protein
MPFPQGHVHVVPHFTGSVGDGAGIIRRPVAGAAVVDQRSPHRVGAEGVELRRSGARPAVWFTVGAQLD